MASELNPSAELNSLMQETAGLIGGKGLGKLITTHQRFDTTFNVMHEDGTTTVEKNYPLKQLLKEVPDYLLAAADAGLSANQTESMLLHMLDATPFDFERNEINLMLLGRLLAQEASLGNKFSRGEVSRMRKMLSITGKYGVIPQSLDGFTTTRRVGVAPAETFDLVSHLPNADGHLAGYSINTFRSAMDTLTIAEVSPDLVVETFQKLGGERPYYRTGAYRTFEQAVIFGSPLHKITPQELMSAYKTHAKKDEDIADFYGRFISPDQIPLGGEEPLEIIIPDVDKAAYFINKPGRLEHHGLPYRTKLSLDEGTKDLQKMAKARGVRYEDIAEGFWVFDPNSEYWYSLGGKTDVQVGRVRHNFIGYDISQLSTNPWMFHTHPEELEIMLTPPRSDFPNRTYRNHTNKFLAATASRADYSTVARFMQDALYPMESRSFIAHSLGITEYGYPNDQAQVTEMGEIARDIRDKALLTFPWEQYVLQSERVPYLPVVSGLMDNLNKRLPKGFSNHLQMSE